MLFDIQDKNQLCKLLAIDASDLDHVLSRVGRYYTPKKMSKRDGRVRTLLVPRGKLRNLQDKIKRLILNRFPWLDCVHGGIRGRSVVSNARPHVGKAVVFSVDIKDFFPHVNPDRVQRIFRGLGFGEEAAGILTKATTWNYQLPQGAPTSTDLANLSLVRADWRMVQLARAHGFSYTRYVDDLYVSGEWRLLKFRRLIPRILESEGFQIKPEKTATMRIGDRQVVTRLVVNAKINPSREWRSDARRHVLDYLRSGDDGVSASINGRLQWLRHINPAAGDKLLARMNSQVSDSR